METQEQLTFLQNDLHKKENGEYNDGYVIITQFMPGGQVMNLPVKASDLADELVKYNGLDDVFYSVNTSYNGHRSSNNIRQLVALYADIDIKEEMDELSRKRKKREIIKKLNKLSKLKIIPAPSFLIDSGGGIHVYWAIKDLPYQATWMWQAVEDHVLFALNSNGIQVDNSVRDSARILRSPGSKNNGKTCEVISRSCIRYDLHDLYNDMIPAPARGPKADPKARAKTLEQIICEGGKIELSSLGYKSKKEMIKNISDTVMSFPKSRFTPYTLHQARLTDITTLCHLRNWDMEGYRNAVMHCYVYWKGIIIRDEEMLLEEATAFNNRFKKPMPTSSLMTIVRSARKAVKKFLKYEEDVKNNVRRRVTKGMRDKPGYWYKNTTLINMLDITPEEQERMITIIEVKEKRSRWNNKKKSLRRNEEGLLEEEILRRNQFIVIAKLKQDGTSMVKIAKALGKDRKTLREKINKTYNKVNYTEIENAIINNEYSEEDIDTIMKNTVII